MRYDVGCGRYVRHGAWLEGLNDFDQGLFGVPPGDALALDPQSRILLEQVQVGTAALRLQCAKLAARGMCGNTTLRYYGIPELRLASVVAQEAAGPSGAALRPAGASVGVYVGCMYSEFLDSVLAPLVRLPPCCPVV